MKTKWAALPKRSSGGQALILLAISFFALLAFVGLVTDVGSIYVAYTQLQRAIDSAAVAAANNIKNPQATYAERKANITEAAREMLKMHDITGVSDLTVYLCNDASRPPSFAAMCPSAGQPPRKLAYVEATQQSPVYFLQIFGVKSFPLHATAVGEAAAVDVVLVFDTSESMGKDTKDAAGNDAYGDGRDFNPTTCNSDDTCQPLKQAKDAAKQLVGNLFNGYDMVGIITYDYDAHPDKHLTTDLGAVSVAIDSIRLHDDPAAAKVAWTLDSPWGDYLNYFNPLFPDDRDGNGEDEDPGLPACLDEYKNILVDGLQVLGENTPDMWDDTTGIACDRDDLLDAFDWNGNGIWSGADYALPGPPDSDHDIAMTKNTLSGTYEDTSLVSTCSGCGIRMATDELTTNGRKDSVWVIVFLSDGIANLSDLPLTNPSIPSQFRYGFCGSDPDDSFWPLFCIDRNCPATGISPWEEVCSLENLPNTAGRYCIDDQADECPIITGQTITHTITSGPYSVEDYAFDMLDRAALLYSDNDTEPAGEDIVVFSIGLGAASDGEALLRYMANVGDDGSRQNDPCEGVPALQNCGNYYYAPNASYLAQIFENIAGRIFTKISR